MKNWNHLLITTALLLYAISTMASNKGKIATHNLCIIADIYETVKSKNNAMLNHIDIILSNGNIPLLLPSKLLYEYINKNVLMPCSFRYFRIPRGGYTKAQFYLCYPESLLSSEKLETPSTWSPNLKLKYQDLKVSDLEKKHGLLLDHFLEVPIEKLSDELTAEECLGARGKPKKTVKQLGNKPKTTVEASTKYYSLERMSQSLLHVLTQIFTPKQYYTQNDQRPRWLLFFTGHGSQYGSNHDELNFLAEEGSICCLRIKIFAQMLNMLYKKYIDLGFVDIETCYGGGINFGCLLFDRRKQKLSTFPFFIGTHTVIGDATTHSSPNTHPEGFCKLIYQTDFNDEAAKKNLGKAYAELIPSPDANNIAGYKPLENDYVVEVPQPWCFRLDAKNTKPDTTIEIPETTAYTLLYTNNINRILKGTDINKIAFISTIPGDTFHVIQKIESIDDTSFDPERFIQNFACIKNLHAEKLFHIKELPESCELLVTLKNSTLEALFIRQDKEQKEYHLYTGSWTKNELDSDDVFHFKSIKEIAQSEAEKVRSQFNREKQGLISLASAQKPYRSLKNAVIEENSQSTQDLIRAVKRNNPNALEKITIDTNVNAITANGEPLLFVALKQKNFDLVKGLVAKGAAMNSTDRSEDQFLFSAIKTKDKELLNFLIEHGMDYKIKDSLGNSALHAAIRIKDTTLIDFFIGKGLSLQEQNNQEYNALEIAVNTFTLEPIQNLIEQHNASIKELSDEKQVALLRKLMSDFCDKVAIYLLNTGQFSKGALQEFLNAQYDERLKGVYKLAKEKLNLL